MINYTHYHAADAHSAVDLWNAALGESFPMDLRLWRQNVDQCARTLAEASLIARDDERAEGGGIVGLLIVKSPKHVCAVMVHPDYRRLGVATEMIAMAEQTIGGDTQAKWVVGQDYCHFFPGVPEEAADARAFFANRLGYRAGAGVAHDLIRELSDYSIPTGTQARIDSLRGEGVELGPCTPRDLSALADHISRNYSPRWLADTIQRLNIETTPAEVIVARRLDSGEIIGFAHTYSHNSRYVGPSIYWRALLGPRYGGLGPMGVAKEHRRTGMGLALLAYSVQLLKDRGVTRMAIDWTELTEFYGKCGFRPWKRYVPMREG